MKGKRKAVTAVLAAVVLLTGALFGTLAYFTDQETVTNTFTIGKVGITLDEMDVKPDGTKDTDERVLENVYHLIPGTTYIKDPTIHVDEDSEDCYLFVKVENGISNVETAVKGKTIADQMKALDWVKVEGIDGVDNLYILRKGDGADKYAVSKGAEVVVFETFTIDGDKVVSVPEGQTVPADKVNLEDYKSAAVKVTAYAIQKAGFEDSTPAQIWNATFGKN